MPPQQTPQVPQTQKPKTNIFASIAVASTALYFILSLGFLPVSRMVGLAFAVIGAIFGIIGFAKRQPKDRAVLALVFALIALIIAVLDMFILRFE